MVNYKNKIATAINRIKVYGKPKIFCIGFNKTGTTSLKSLFTDLGFIIGEQRIGELLINELPKGEYRGLINYIKTAQFFKIIHLVLPVYLKYSTSFILTQDLS